MSNYLSGAEAPFRSNGTITLSWGTLAVSLSLYTGTEETTLGRKEFVTNESDPDWVVTDHPAGRATIDKITGDIVDNSRVVRLSEANNGAWVAVTDDEMASIVGVRNVAEILAFVPANEARLRYVPSAYMQLRPKKYKGVYDPASAKAYALFLEALNLKGVWALVNLATRGPARYGLITETGDFLYVHATDEVRKPVPMSLPVVDPAHLDMALQLIDAIGVMMAPELPNKTAEGLRALVNAKAGGVIVGLPAEPPATPEVDLMATLQASIEAKKNGQPMAWPAPTAPAVEVGAA